MVQRRNFGKPKTGRHHKNVVWTGGRPSAPDAPFTQDISTFRSATEALPQGFDESLVPGAIWFARINLARDASKFSDKVQHLLEYWGPPENAPYKAGSILLYAGAVRVDEKTSTGKIVSVMRHSFMAHEGIVIVPIIPRLIAPVSMKDSLRKEQYDG